MQIPYYYLFLFVSMVSEDESIETIDELIDFLEENEHMSFHISQK